MKRKILSLILVFAMTVSLLTVGTGAVEPTYGDTAGHWAESSIERWSGHGIIQGSNGLFDPNGQLTCAQLATILAKLLKLPVAKDAGFTDNTADAWYYDAINRCAAAGILNGNGDGTVTPEAPITRERAMVMLARALGIEPIRKPDLTKYTDAAQVSAYAQGYVAALIEAGIVGGVTADELAPQDNITRAATVTILDRAIDTYADKAGATVKADGKGIVLVVADDVTVTGSVDKLLVPANDIEVTVKGSKNIDDITVSGDNSKVILDNASADNVTLDGEKSAVETKNGAKIDNVIVTENAPGATVDVGSGTTVGNVENHAEDATVTGNGTVKKVESDKDITVKTKDTDVKNIGDEKITVTDKSGKDTTIGTTGSGSSTTVNKGTTSSGGGGGSSSPSYSITVDKTKNGTITVSPRNASHGDTVTITATPDKGYELEMLKVLDRSGDALKLTEKNGKYTFKMPSGKVTIKASFVEEVPEQLFKDVPANAYYYEAVKWAQEKGITGGIGNGLFGPNDPCTRAQIVTFLWRAAGSPAPKSMSSFTDVPADAFYAKAVAWAVENGITSGTGESKFSPNATCTRAQAVTFLYRASGSPAVSGSAEFSDVSATAFYADAVAWAAKKGITTGIGGGLFGADNDCTRGQIVTFLWRCKK